MDLIKTNKKPLGSKITATLNKKIVKEFSNFIQLNNSKNLKDILHLFFNEFALDFLLEQRELKRIPTSGSSIVYSNYSKNYLHYLYFLYIGLLVRDDVKIIAPKNLSRIKGLEKYIINAPKRKLNFDNNLQSKAINEANNHLKNNGIVLISVFKKRKKIKKRFTSKAPIWEKHFSNYTTENNIQINALLIEADKYLLKVIAKKLFFKLTKEDITNIKRKPIIHVRISKTIQDKQIKNRLATKRLTPYLKNKLFALKKDKKKRFRNLFKVKNKSLHFEDIPKEPSKILIEKAIKQIKPSQLLLKRKSFKLFLISSTENPIIIKEIGRLREITFRKVGEGTGKAYDLDEYDYYYKHLFIWDEKEKTIVGSYRVGFGQKILNEFGLSGFYTNELFKFKPELSNYLEQTIELGRSFIRSEYQKHPIILLFLWQGILELLVKNPDHRYLFGAVSISNSYSRIAKEIMVSYLKQNYQHKDLKKLIEPRNPFTSKKKKVVQSLLTSKPETIRELDAMIDDFDRHHNNTPVLIKRYLEQNAKILGFNVDPNFSDCIDALVLLDFKELPQETIKKLSSK